MLQSIIVSDYGLTIEGLSISYTTEGKELTLIADPLQTVELFKKLGIIQDYDSYRDEPVILFEAEEGYTDEYGQRYRRTGTAWMYWSDFVQDFKTSDYYSGRSMRVICEHHEEMKRIKTVLHSTGIVFDLLRGIA